MEYQKYSIFFCYNTDMGGGTAQTVWEIALSCDQKNSGGIELVHEVLLNLGYKDEELVESILDERSYISLFLQKKSQTEKIIKKFEALKLNHVKIKSTKLNPENWRDKWKENLQPFSLTKSFDVVPLWHLKKYKKNKKQPIYIDTIVAFGTGLHETTRFMAELIESKNGKFKTFFDIGTGTGILSIIARKCGAEIVRGIDIDPTAIKVAKANMAANGTKFTQTFSKDVKELKKDKEFDFVAANLVTDVIIKHKNKILSFVKPGQFLAVSGISLENLPRVQKAYALLPVRCLKISKGKKWAAILYKKESV